MDVRANLIQYSFKIRYMNKGKPCFTYASHTLTNMRTFAYIQTYWNQWQVYPYERVHAHLQRILACCNAPFSCLYYCDFPHFDEAIWEKIAVAFNATSSHPFIRSRWCCWCCWCRDVVIIFCFKLILNWFSIRCFTILLLLLIKQNIWIHQMRFTPVTTILAFAYTRTLL